MINSGELDRKVNAEMLPNPASRHVTRHAETSQALRPSGSKHRLQVLAGAWRPLAPGNLPWHPARPSPL